MTFNKIFDIDFEIIEIYTSIYWNLSSIGNDLIEYFRREISREERYQFHVIISEWVLISHSVTAID